MNTIEYIAKQVALREKQAGIPWGKVLQYGGPVVGGVTGGLIGGDVGEDIGDAIQGASMIGPQFPISLAVNTAMDLIPGLGPSFDELSKRQTFGQGDNLAAKYGRPLLSMAAHPVSTLLNWGRALIPGTGNSLWGHKPPVAAPGGTAPGGTAPGGTAPAPVPYLSPKEHMYFKRMDMQQALPATSNSYFASNKPPSPAAGLGHQVAQSLAPKPAANPLGHPGGALSV